MRSRFLLAACCLCLFITAQSARAAGIGFYGTGGVNLSTWKYKGTSANTTDYYYGGGMAIDSVVARDQVFGYRFTAGYEQYILKDPETGATGKPLNRFSMSHTFGFGVARAQNVRFWIGPQLGMHYMYKRATVTVYQLVPLGGRITIQPMDVRIKIDDIGVDALLGLGLNINMGDVMTLFFDIGFGYMGNFNINTSEIGHGFGAQAKAGIMFRINDTYSSSGERVIN